MVVSMVVMAILVGAMASSIVLATKALPSADGPVAAGLEASRVLDQLRDELHAAAWLPSLAPRGVVINLPDRDGDGRPEVVKYEWSGVAGDPLTRQQSGGSIVTVLAGVDSFALGYDLDLYQTTHSGAPVEQAESLLGSYENTSTNVIAYGITYDQWAGYRLTPALPSGATSYRVTRVFMQLRPKDTADGENRFELRRWSNNSPAATVEDVSTLSEGTLPSGGAWWWAGAVFPGDTTFAPGETASITLGSSNSQAESAEVRILYGINGSNLHLSNNRGGSWTVYSDEYAVPHQTYGRVSLPGPDWTILRGRVRRVDIALSARGSPTQRVGTLPPNAPQAVLVGWWADFDADPTTLDRDADGTADFTSTPAFDPTRLSDGAWHIQNGLSLAPQDYAFDEPATIHWVARDLTADNQGAGFTTRFGRVGGLASVLHTHVSLVGSTQRVTLSRTDSSGGGRTLYQTTRPATSDVVVSLVIDPDESCVALLLDGSEAGVFTVDPIADDASPSLGFTADSDNSGVWSKLLTVNVGGIINLAP